MWLIWARCSIRFPLLFHTLKLVGGILQDSVQIRYVPLASRKIPFPEIEHFGSGAYSPILVYGGWGIRGWGESKRAYNVSGNRGVELALRNGRTVMIGSQETEELALAIAGGLATRRAVS
jgi:hypothetical protein